MMTSPFARNRIDYVSKLVNPSRKDKILNVGVSNIPEIEMVLEDRVAECWTVDLDKPKIEKAKRFLKKTKFVYGDITKKNPLPANYFDKVVVLEVLEHLKDDISTLKFLNSRMKKNGIIILSVPNDAFLHYFNPVKYTQHERHYSKRRIIEAVKTAGFEILHYNVVERWTLLANLYLHLFRKYILHVQKPFLTFKKLTNKSYSQLNSRGMDIIIAAKKI